MKILNNKGLEAHELMKAEMANRGEKTRHELNRHCEHQVVRFPGAPGVAVLKSISPPKRRFINKMKLHSYEGNIEKEKEKNKNVRVRV
jgi:hypothetical protein